MYSPLHFKKWKYSFVISILLVVFCMSYLMSENKAPSVQSAKKHFFHMQGHLENEKDISKTMIEILHAESSLRYDLIESDSISGLCSIKLPLQGNFLIKFMKYGHHTKKIVVNTHVPEKMSGNYYCEFDYEMFPQIPEVNAAPMLKEPVAIFFFNEKIKNFYYDKNATDKINNEIKLMYTQYSAFTKTPNNDLSRKSNRRIPAVLK